MWIPGVGLSDSLCVILAGFFETTNEPWSFPQTKKHLKLHGVLSCQNGTFPSAPWDLCLFDFVSKVNELETYSQKLIHIAGMKSL
jgi:hypothetical protein